MFVICLQTNARNQILYFTQIETPNAHNPGVIHAADEGVQISPLARYFSLLNFAGVAVYSVCIILNIQGFLPTELLRRHLSFVAQASQGASIMLNLNARLEAAALSLAGPGHIKDRLLDAYCRYLQDIQESDLPGEMGLEFAAMIHALHRSPALPGDDVVKASVRKLSNEEACHYAELVVRLYGMLAGLHHHSAPRSFRPVVPLAKYLSAEASSP